MQLVWMFAWDKPQFYHKNGKIATIHAVLVFFFCLSSVVPIYHANSYNFVFAQFIFFAVFFFVSEKLYAAVFCVDEPKEEGAKPLVGDPERKAKGIKRH